MEQFRDWQQQNIILWTTGLRKVHKGISIGVCPWTMSTISLDRRWYYRQWSIFPKGNLFSTQFHIIHFIYFREKNVCTEKVYFMVWTNGSQMFTFIRVNLRTRPFGVGSHEFALLISSIMIWCVWSQTTILESLV